MRSHGFTPSVEDLEDMIRSVDKKDNGAVDFNEFIEMMLNTGTNCNDADTAHAAHAFKVFDRDGDGQITAEELKLTMNSLGEPLTEVEVKMMILEADVDGDGQINFDEFQSLMANKFL